MKFRKIIKKYHNHMRLYDARALETYKTKVYSYT